MANNKNQHFVPRCYLKPFTLDGNGVAINVYNLPRKKFVAAAAVKHQCARNYFYGQNPGLERGIQAMEGGYASVVRRIRAADGLLPNSDKSFLLSFWIFQYLRTEASKQDLLRQSAQMQDAIGSKVPELDISNELAVALALDAFAHNSDAIADLNLVVVKNRTAAAFLTSDNPAVRTNRWALSRSHRGATTCGLHSAGLITMLPIAPDMLVMMYDKDVYSIPHTEGAIVVSNLDDVAALNLHQLLNCAENIYSATDRESVESLPDVSKQRAASGPQVRVFQERRRDEGRYYATAGFDRTTDAAAILQTFTDFAEPGGWPSFLHWRSGGCYFSNGTGAGPLRRHWAKPLMGGIPFQKVHTGH